MICQFLSSSWESCLLLVDFQKVSCHHKVGGQKLSSFFAATFCLILRGEMPLSIMLNYKNINVRSKAKYNHIGNFSIYIKSICRLHIEKNSFLASLFKINLIISPGCSHPFDYYNHFSFFTEVYSRLSLYQKLSISTPYPINTSYILFALGIKVYFCLYNIISFTTIVYLFS